MNKLCKWWTVTLFALIVFGFTASFAQKDTTYTFNKHYGWAAIGLGLSEPFYFNANLGATYLLKNTHAFQINHFFIGTVPKENTLQNLTSWIFSYGLNKSVGRLNSFIFSAGLSYGQGTYYKQDTAVKNNRNWLFPFNIQPRKYDKTAYEYYGLYLTGQYLFRTAFYGLGLKLYCNIHKHTDYGWTLSHNFGYLNKPRRKNNGS